MNAEDKDIDNSPWHEGERAMQTRAGVARRMEQVGRRTIRSFMPDQHREFFAGLPFVLIGSVDSGNQPWASLLPGAPGFATSPDPRTLRIAAPPLAGDPLADALALGAPLGVLGIDLATRRRNRVNGCIAATDQAGFSVAVHQSFGNCPQYIQRRDYVSAAPPRSRRVEALTGLDAEARQLIARADTLFVASSAPARETAGTGGVDVSHRGGRPGFADITEGDDIVVPDYRGNRYFNTLGNLLVNPRAGLLFVDFETGDLLQLAGATEILWEGPEIRVFAGAERLWRLTPARGRWIRGALPFRLALREFSPEVLATGTWQEAQAALPTQS